MTKNEFVEELEEMYYGGGYYNNNSMLGLIIKLVKGTDENDVDFKEALADNMTMNIVDLFLECYTENDFLEWLNNHDYDLFVDYRYADKDYKHNYASDDDFIEKSRAFYNGEVDCLMYNDDCYVISW